MDSMCGRQGRRDSVDIGTQDFYVGTIKPIGQIEPKLKLVMDKLTDMSTYRAVIALNNVVKIQPIGMIIRGEGACLFSIEPIFFVNSLLKGAF